MSDQRSAGPRRPIDRTVPEAARHLIHNERTKLLAAAIDRVSTACVTTGIAAPIVGHLIGPTTSYLPFWFYGTTFVLFAALAVLLHLVARHVVGDLRS